ncbi:MAG: aminoacyl-tRNA hydrolase [Candidatus Paceibacterota bacterium]
MYYVFGLGNPGAEYADTRHSVGRTLIERFADSQSASFSNERNAQALIAHVDVAGVPTMLVLPETFMNRSGETARFLKEKRGALPKDCIVVYDDVDLPLGTIRVTQGRGDGGHNGIKSFVEGLKSKEFVRIRIGIAPTSFWTGKVKRPTAGGPLERFVLGRFSRSEQAKLDGIFERTARAIETIVVDGVERAMNEFNSGR